MLAVELEVMAKKMDRFGWDRDRGTAAHDRIITDWMKALADYPLSEVQEACQAWVLGSPRKMPNEGDILGLINRQRSKAVAAFMADRAEDLPEHVPCTPETAAAIMAEAGFNPKRFGGEE